ncbi:hypothetical protein HOY80DRAFT_1044022 [Tuber brumale]|nr:hypothetical protein HOY80DRAFT_1044022 [Tuber brumale]
MTSITSAAQGEFAWEDLDHLLHTFVMGLREVHLVPYNFTRVGLEEGQRMLRQPSQQEGTGAANWSRFKPVENNDWADLIRDTRPYPTLLYYVADQAGGAYIRQPFGSVIYPLDELSISTSPSMETLGAPNATAGDCGISEWIEYWHSNANGVEYLALESLKSRVRFYERIPWDMVTAEDFLVEACTYIIEIYPVTGSISGA